MPPLTQPVDVIMERIPLQSRWASERWQAAGVEIALPAGATRPRDTVPGTIPCEPAGENHWRCHGLEIELHRTEAEGYFMNLTAPDPRVFVLWRMFDDGRQPAARPVLLTVSYNEAGRLMDSGEQVDGVPMIPAIAEWMRAFVAVHYKPEPRRKPRRDDAPAGDAGERDRGAPR
ncbi:MAG TPA: DUF3305 domain-containing protein [Casimicrobiaceae bacterium]